MNDAKLRFYARIVVGIFFSVLLWIQNVIVFQIVFIAYVAGKLHDLSTIFSIIIPATLAETAAITHTMVVWIFKDTDYRTHK
ncbi:MAG: hypothetical protein WC477_03735 [Patescibacteria group bacterium]